MGIPCSSDVPQSDDINDPQRDKILDVPSEDHNAVVEEPAVSKCIQIFEGHNFCGFCHLCNTIEKSLCNVCTFPMLGHTFT